MDGAEVYMLMIRKSGLPILGEAMAPPFNQQVEVLDWNWKIVNQEEVERRAKEDAETEVNAKSDKEVKLEFNVLAEDVADPEADAELKALVARTNSNDPKSVRAALKEIDEIRKRSSKATAGKLRTKAKNSAEDAMEAYEKEKKQAELGNLEFSFSKRVDFASTQMLNCMKAGEILPRVVITIFHRSVSAPLNIVVTAKNLRFLKYDLNVEVDDTMADMKEDWEAEFSEISFSYTNTRGVDQQKGRLGTDSLAGAKLARAAAQTTSLFVMKSRD
jgi:type VI protein secretion system component Hcp